MIRPTLLALVALVASGPKPADDLKAFQGRWTMVSMTSDGAGATAEQIESARLVIEDDRFTPTFDGNVIPCAFRIDPSTNPKSIDITYTSGNLKGLTVKGIYKTKGDTFTLCRALRPKDDRPTEFASEAGSMHVLVTWARAR